MTYFPALPPEIIRLILQQLGHVSVLLQDYNGDGHDAYKKTASQVKAYASTRDLLNVCFLSKAWCREAQMILYSNINCTGRELLFGASAMQSQEYMMHDDDIWDGDGDDDDDDSMYESDDEQLYMPDPGPAVTAVAPSTSAWTDGNAAGLIEPAHEEERRIISKDSKRNAKDDEYSDNESMRGGSDGFAEESSSGRLHAWSAEAGLAFEQDDAKQGSESEDDKGEVKDDESNEGWSDQDEPNDREREQEDEIEEDEPADDEDNSESYHSEHHSDCCPETRRLYREDSVRRYRQTSPSDSISTKLIALRQTLSTSPSLASHVKTFSFFPAMNGLIDTLAFCKQVEEVCFAYEPGCLPPKSFWKEISKLQRLQICQLLEFPVAYTHRILSALSHCPSFKILRLSTFRWTRSDEEDTEDENEEDDDQLPDTEEGEAHHKEYVTDLNKVPPYSLDNIRELLIDSACLSTSDFRTLLSHLHPERGTRKLEIRLHGISWAEDGDSYDPFNGLSSAIQQSITTYKLRESSLEVSDFRGIEHLSALQTLGIFASHFETGFNSNSVTLPPSITTIELGYNLMSTRDGSLPVTTVLEAWVHKGKLPNLKTLSFKPGDFAYEHFESYCSYDTYDAVAEEITSVRQRVQSFQEMLDAHEVHCNMRVTADFQRFVDHINPLWNDSQPWEGLLVERLDALEDTGAGYTPWKA